MILKPKGLEELKKQLFALPEEKRKVIILVGRHPNEGTGTIAQSHHQEWAKEGAVTVQLPPHWTPHAFWHEAMKENLSSEKVNEKIKDVPNDNSIAHFLAEEGLQVPVVFFHSTFRPAWKIRLLKFLGYINFHHLPHLDFFCAGWGNIPPHNSIRQHFLSQRPHENAVVVEFYSEGTKMKKLKSFPYAKKIYLPYHSQMESSYLENRRFTKDDIKIFSEKSAGQFQDLLRHLAEKGLEKIYYNR